MSVIKSMSRGTRSFGQLAKYILDEKKNLRAKDGQPYVFRHNVSGGTTRELVDAFRENEKNRAFSRKGSRTMYHEVISWHAKDADKINVRSVEAIARKYAELRNVNALYVGGIHEDKDSKHLHLMISAVEAYSGKSIRISKERFEQVKKELQAFEQERFGLVHSQVEHGKHSMRKSGREYQLEKRTGKPSRKEEIKAILEKAFNDSLTRDEFYTRVREHGLSTYERGEKTAGVDDGRHYRFATMGFGNDKFEELSAREQRLDEMKEIRGTREYDSVRGLESKNEGGDAEKGEDKLPGDAEQEEILER